MRSHAREHQGKYDVPNAPTKRASYGHPTAAGYQGPPHFLSHCGKACPRSPILPRSYPKMLSDDHGLPTFLGRTGDGETVLREVAPVLISSSEDESIVSGSRTSAPLACRLLPTTLIEDGERLRVMEPTSDTLTIADGLACERLEMRPSPLSILHSPRHWYRLEMSSRLPSRNTTGQCVLHWALHPGNVHIQRQRRSVASALSHHFTEV